ncbi:MAG: 30S ribosomal protein S16 [candidate division FCPU426 bacterium]
MATLIKLQRYGTVHKPFWRIVVTDSRKPKGCIEQLGTYDNLRKPVKLTLNEDKAKLWISRGAVLTMSVRKIFHRRGLLAASNKTSGASA